MLHFEGDKTFPRPPAALWSKLTDAGFVVACIPDVEAITAAEELQAVFVLRPGFSFVRGTLDVTLRITDKVPNQMLRVAIESKGIGSRGTVQATAHLTPIDSGSQLHWTADVLELGGLLKMVPRGLIQAAAQKVIADVWTGIETKLSDQL